MTESRETWSRVTHPDLGVSIEVPSSLEVTVQPEAAAAIVAVEPGEPGWLPSSVVVTVEEPGAEPGWEAASRDLLLRSFWRACLLDDRPRELVDGTPALNIVVLYQHLEAGATVLDQLLVRHRGRGVVVSCTTPALWHGGRLGVFARAQASLGLPAEWPAA